MICSVLPSILGHREKDHGGGGAYGTADDDGGDGNGEHPRWLRVPSF